MSSKEKPYVLYVAELIYSKICQIRKKNPDFSNKITSNSKRFDYQTINSISKFILCKKSFST